VLTASDKTLLNLLQSDAGLSARDLADRSGMSQATVWRRLRDFEASGLIRQRVVRLDPEKLDLGVCMMINVNITDQTAEARHAFETMVAARQEIQLCMAVTGAHDYILRVWTTNVAAFQRFLMDSILAHPSVASAHSQLVLRTSKDSAHLPIF
jgi:Lrp/AsnC family transcriptional regulator